MPRKLNKEDLKQQIISHLAAEPEGMGSADLRDRLRPRISQPTLSRVLTELRSRGLVTATGRGRATRYHLVGGRRSLAELRSRLLHQSVARRLVERPELLLEAHDRLARLREVNPAGARYHDRWEALLNDSLPELLRIISADGPEAAVLRKESPLTVLARRSDRRKIFTGTHEPPAA
jgi:DNA-binding transcriptional ArsR family regulator